MIRPRTYSYTFQKATAGNPFGMRMPHAGRVVGVYIYCEGGTSATCNVNVDAATAGTFVDLLTADKTAAAGSWVSAASTISATNKILAAGRTIKPEIVSVSGTPTNVTIQVDIQYDSDAR